MIPFSGNPLNRASEKRGDGAWIAARRHDPSSLILPLWCLQSFLLGDEQATPQLGFLRPGVADSLAAPDAPCIFLGLKDERAYFAFDISAAANPAQEGALAGLGRFREARSAAMVLPLRDTAILGQAKALIGWHNRNGYCANCGAATVIADAGWKRDCPACKAEHFPRTDPVVIMLATHSDSKLGDACLVGRGRHFTPGMYSALAGFIEPGETIEEAVRRELMEEAGVRANAVTYHAAQPWPFASSLMIGCFAQTESRDLRVDHVEIEDARWLARDVVRALLAGERMDGMLLPQPIAIAHHLLKAWAERG